MVCNFYIHIEKVMKSNNESEKNMLLTEKNI